MDRYPKTDLEFEALFESVYKRKVDASQLHELQKRAIVDQIRSKRYGKSIQNKGFDNSLAKPRIKTKADADALLAYLDKVYQMCRSEEKLITMPASMQGYMNQFEPIKKDLRKEYSNEKLNKADGDPSVPDINICIAILKRTISSEEAIVPQLRPISTHNPTEEQNN